MIALSLVEIEVCAVETHAAMKLDDATWDRLAYVGLMDDGDDCGRMIELRNCKCGSTISRLYRDPVERFLMRAMVLA